MGGRDHTPSIGALRGDTVLTCSKCSEYMSWGQHEAICNGLTSCSSFQSTFYSGAN